MKIFISILLIVLVINPCESHSQANQKKANFDWLVGNWIRTNNKENQITFENWKKKSESEYKGFSYTMQNADTVWHENVTLIQINNLWSLNVTGKGEVAATRFKLTTIKKGMFVCENPANEFPKRIEYLSAGKKLNAKISGGGPTIDFVFERIDK